MSGRWPIHTLVFDLDDTLFAERDFVRGGFEAAGQWLEKERGVRGFTVAAMTLLDQGERGTIFDQVLAQFGLAPDAANITGLVQAYRAYRPVLTLCPDAADCLAWAAGRFRLALVTDGYRDVQERKIAALGLEHRISCRILTDALGREFWKPSPAGFKCVMETLPGRPDGFVYVADNPRKDFIAPRALGWRTVRIRRAGGEHAASCAAAAEVAEREVESLTELCSLLEAVPNS